MIKIAIYGKGGIGKSTVSSNVSAALAQKGMKVMQIGCDPKADSTSLLHGGKRIPTVLDLTRQKGNKLTLEEVVFEGEFGVKCVEAGGPVPGIGCAGRGIINALETLKKLGAYEVYQPDVVIYDVLGDVVCGGFSMPMRKGYADKVFVVTSGEKMSRYAAANICMAVENFKGRGYASLGGIILNRRGVRGENEGTEELAADFNTTVIGSLDRSEEITFAEERGKPVSVVCPESRAVTQLDAIAQALLDSFKE
ncbi:nitrogenase iron protein NifH [Ruminococcus sp. YE71]|uniref:nucleotide-binding protein n=1 Tax=unclassified Ruminococcus TaxID=2608920 RepID=UPI0008902DEF|nr:MULTISPECIES: nitrogenase iron protein NifH [unclassified Ruminococcus]SDA12045.1 nitrogenase iron protein NifH [Ruminococcus sp. YE78]SFW16155.1 nitrogenase iron protein NifH [Ruminococcus sp. YE71]